MTQSSAGPGSENREVGSRSRPTGTGGNRERNFHIDRETGRNREPNFILDGNRAGIGNPIPVRDRERAGVGNRTFI